jgi:3'(2'), 5'-bisphosphate nucleotidase
LIAVRGQGTWITSFGGNNTEFAPLHVSTIDKPKHARLMRSVESGHTNVSEIDHIAGHLATVAAPVQMDSQAKYAVLAAGGGEVLLRLLSPGKETYKERIWDQAAGSIILEEAGGKITDLYGKTLDFSQGRTLSKNTGLAQGRPGCH